MVQCLYIMYIQIIIFSVQKLLSGYLEFFKKDIVSGQSRIFFLVVKSGQIKFAMGIFGFYGIGYNEAQRFLCFWVFSIRSRCFRVFSREFVSFLQYLCLLGFLFIFVFELGIIEIELISCIDLFSWLCVIQIFLCVFFEGILDFSF